METVARELGITPNAASVKLHRMRARLRTFLKETHPNSQVLAIDAAVGEEGDIGLIKLNDTPLMPGAGANKRLGSLGDISLMGVIAEKSLTNYGLLKTTRLNLVYSMAEIVSDGLAALLWERCARQKTAKSMEA